MVFMGSETFHRGESAAYPYVNFGEYVAKEGGATNAYTSGLLTNYMFEVSGTAI